MQPARRTPDVAAAREALSHALRLLGDPQTLDSAREEAQRAVAAIPYPWRAPHYNQRRRNLGRETCGQPTCSRCAAYEAGEPMPVGDY
jgi:hypothetical protein